MVYAQTAQRKVGSHVTVPAQFHQWLLLWFLFCCITRFFFYFELVWWAASKPASQPGRLASWPLKDRKKKREKKPDGPNLSMAIEDGGERERKKKKLLPNVGEESSIDSATALFIRGASI